MDKIGCPIERFLAPVEPGNLLLMGYKDEMPIMSAPGCFRSLKAERDRPDAAATDGALPGLDVGSLLPRTRRPAELTVNAA